MTLSKRCLVLAFLVAFLFPCARPLLAQPDDSSGGSNMPYKPSYRYYGPESGNISESDIHGKDPIVATMFAVLPGVFVHGFGNYYAGNYSFGNHMLAMEIFGAGVSLWGYQLVHNPGAWSSYFGGDDNTQQAGYWIKAGGLGLMVLSWIGDVATASDSAIQYNRDHELNFKLESSFNQPKVVLSCRF